MRILPALLLVGIAFGGTPEGWHKQRKDGEEAAKKSGKPLLVVTMWSEKT